jgi:hypothetical protein
MKQGVFILLFLCSATSLVLQELHALVYFKDKADVVSYLANPSTMLSQRSMDRKSRHNIFVFRSETFIQPRFVTFRFVYTL